jgi:hypothetical protein
MSQESISWQELSELTHATQVEKFNFCTCEDNEGQENPFADCPTDKPYDRVGGIIAYETGELDEDGILELFQHLVDTGLAWQLQGHYGRTATALLDVGAIKRKFEVVE